MASFSIDVSCPECGSNHHVNARLAGHGVRCPHCDARVIVPALPVADTYLPAAEAELIAADAMPAGTTSADAAARGSDDVLNGQVVAELADGLPSPVVFDSDPVFDSAGHHAATDLPDLPPALQDDSEDGDPPTRTKRKEDELDMTPMVDVTFLLLIFFMVTASFSLQKSIEVPRQQTDLASSNPVEPDEEVDMITVQIDEFGSFLVLAPDWERETPGKQDLISALREAMGEGGGSVRLAIEVHEDAKLRYLVDCMDSGAITGYSEVQITQVEGFD